MKTLVLGEVSCAMCNGKGRIKVREVALAAFRLAAVLGDNGVVKKQKWRDKMIEMLHQADLADTAIRELTREGAVFETRPGFYRLISP